MIATMEDAANTRPSAIRTAVVSGGNGYVGSSLIRRLLALGVEVHALSNANHQRLDSLLPAAHIHELKDGAREAADLVMRIQPDVIFHLAAVYSEPVSVDCIQSMIDGNLALGATLLFAATRCAVAPAFINTGTYWQFAEDSTYAPNTLYAATKQGFQDILTFYRTHHAIPCTTLVLYDVFGPGDDRPKLWNRITRCAPRTHIPLSPGTQEIELVHIDDVLDAFQTCAEGLCSGKALDELYSVDGLHRRTLRELLEAFNAAADLELGFGWGELPFWGGVVQRPWRGERLPGWTPRRDVLHELLAMVPHGATA